MSSMPSLTCPLDGGSAGSSAGLPNHLGMDCGTTGSVLAGSHEFDGTAAARLEG